MGLLFEAATWDLVILLLVVAYIFFRLLNKHSDYWKVRGIPYVEQSLFSGTLLEVILKRKSFWEIQNDLYEKLPGEKLFGYFQGLTPCLMIRDPDLIQKILKTDFQHFTSRGLEMDEENDPLSVNVSIMDGEQWRRTRQKMTPMFTSGKLKNMLNEINFCSQLMVELLDKTKGSAVEARETMSKFSIEIIGRCVFGIQSNAITNPNSEFFRNALRLSTPSLKSLIKNTIVFFSPRMKRFLRIKSASPDLEKFYTDVIMEALEFRSKHNVHRNDFLQLMINERDREELNEDEVANDEVDPLIDQLKNVPVQNASVKSKVFTDSSIVANCFVFLTGGSDTVTAANNFVLYLLAKNQKYQEILHNEIDSVLTKYNGMLTYQALKEMSYLDRCIDESLRLYSPAQVLFRKCSMAYSFPGTHVRIDPGVRVTIPVNGLHTDPQYYANPHSFIPDRPELNNKNSGTYMPWGDGPRICIAVRFAMLEMKSLMVHIFSHFEVKVSERMQEPLQFEPKAFPLIQVKGGIWLEFIKRSTCSINNTA